MPSAIKREKNKFPEKIDKLIIKNIQNALLYKNSPE